MNLIDFLFAVELALHGYVDGGYNANVKFHKELLFTNIKFRHRFKISLNPILIDLFYCD